MATPAPAPAAAAPAAPAAAGTQPPPLASASLYVGDLDPNVTEPQLFETFSVVGPVASIRVCRDAMTRRSLGYAYVNFHNVVDAERALDTLNYTEIKGKACRIMWKHRDPSIRKSGAGNIFIKNLEKNVDTRTLHDTFSQFGNILSCKVSSLSVQRRGVVGPALLSEELTCTGRCGLILCAATYFSLVRLQVTMDDQGNSRGFGFVQFETAEEANEAISKVNGMHLPPSDKRLFVGPFIPRGERDAVTGERKYTNVYVKNIPDDVSDEKFQAEFEKHGKVTSSKIMRKEDGTSRCFGFVNYESADEAKTAVEAINATKCFGGDKEVYAGRAEKESERKDKLKKKYDSIRMERLKNNQLVNLYIKNLDDTIDDDKLRAAFETFGTISSAKVMKDKERSDVSKGFGFVCFAQPEEATRAVTAMNGQMLGTKPIYVALHQPIEIRRQMQAAQGQRQPQMLPRFQVQGGMPMVQGGMRMPFPGGGPPGQFVMFPQGMPGQFRGQQQYRGQQGQYGMPQGARQGQRQGGNYAQSGQRQGGQQQPRQQQQQKGQQQARAPAQGQQARAPAAAAAAPVAAQTPPSSMSKDQLMQMLVNAPAAQAKQILGERLYALIQAENQPLAGKITGMLLEGLDNSELVALIDDSSALKDKINEALQALEAHAAQAKAAGH
jgi:polyadenylate-binding protein